MKPSLKSSSSRWYFSLEALSASSACLRSVMSLMRAATTLWPSITISRNLISAMKVEPSLLVSASSCCSESPLPPTLERYSFIASARDWGDTRSMKGRPIRLPQASPTYS